MPRTTTRLFTSRHGQAVLIPKALRFDTDEVYIERDGDRIVLTPKAKTWKQYFEHGRRFSADFPDRIEDLDPGERESL